MWKLSAGGEWNECDVVVDVGAINVGRILVFTINGRKGGAVRIGWQPTSQRRIRPGIVSWG